jgi:hypothetical protein
MVQCSSNDCEAKRADARTAAVADAEQAPTPYIQHDNQFFAQPHLQETNGSAMFRSWFTLSVTFARSQRFSYVQVLCTPFQQVAGCNSSRSGS